MDDSKKGLDFNATIEKDLSAFNISIRLDMAKEKGDGMFTIFDLKDVDGCNFLSDKQSSVNFVQLFRNMVVDSTRNLPTCPVKKGTKLIFSNMSMDPNRFPYLPESKFVIRTQFRTNFIYLTVKIYGKVNYVKRRKLRI